MKWPDGSCPKTTIQTSIHEKSPHTLLRKKKETLADLTKGLQVFPI
ncbi:hypothetical protein STRDD11_01037 [Streptococcus sp. DD11]|nr:hypothetical protein STRDD11_01037 [Streptococcus sp. DD11]